MSPGHNAGEQDQGEDILIYSEREDVAMNRVSQSSPQQPSVSVDQPSPSATTSEGQRPQRLPEDETVHLHNAELRLTGFEVCGTPGHSTCDRVFARHHHPSTQSHFALKVLQKSEINDTFYFEFSTPSSLICFRNSRIA
ncbi:cytochrome c oxidase subunit 1 [Marasmius tenuissimus]|uniref:Cytochrome c oxidase subunit 1 n=1 Tax=Marasmius tenuissimus TaxID=585030 RepID=A0ABR2ZB51_9AGAR